MLPLGAADNNCQISVRMASSIAPAGEAAGGPLLSALNPSDIHVLLVDDERLTRLVVGNLLRTCKYKVTIAESGTQALDVLSKAGPGAFQLILTDVMMPDVGGLELLRFVRSHQHLYNVPVIMMSASEAQETMCAALLGSADEYLVKPVTRKEVQNIWMHVMKRYHNAAAQPAAAAAAAAAQPAAAHASSAEDPAAAAAPGGGGALGGVAGLTPLAGHANGVAAFGAAAAAAAGGAGALSLSLSRGPLLSLGLGGAGALGLSPEVARDMMRAAALAASTTAAAGAAAAAGGTAATAALPSGALEDGREGSAGPLEVGAAIGAGVHVGAAAGAEGPGSRAAAAAIAGSSPPPDGPQHPHGPVKPPQPHVGCSGQQAPAGALAAATAAGAPAAAAGGGGNSVSGSGHGASKVNLLKWLRRSNRCVQPKESFWIFCEVLLLLDSCQAAAAGARACGLRPSKLVLYSNGRVAFAPAAAAPPPLPAAAAAAIACSGGGGGGGTDARKKRRRQSGGHSPPGPEEELSAGAAAPVAAAAGAGAGGGVCGCGGAYIVGGQTQAQPLPTTVGTGCPRATAPAAAATEAAAVATATALPPPAGSDFEDEDALYRSPEEALGQPVTAASDMFSLGLLFFELFYVCAGQERAALLRDARQRVLPPSFGRQQPKEAAFALALLHPEPACRPTLAELLGSAMFRATCASLRQRGHRQQQQQQQQQLLQQQQQQQGGSAAGAAAGGREPQLQQEQHRHTNHNREPAQAPAQGRTAAAGGGSSTTAAAKEQQQQQHPQQHQAHRLANRRGAGAGAAPAEAASKAAAAPAPAPGAAAGAGAGAEPGNAASTLAVFPSASGSMGGGAGGPLRVDDAVLLEFLRMLRKRKLEELAQVGSQLAFLTADAQMVEQYLLYMHQTRTMKRQRGGGGGGGGAAAAGGGSAMLPPPPPPSHAAHAQQTTSGGDALGISTAATATAGAGAAGGGAEVPAQVLASPAAAAAPGGAASASAAAVAAGAAAPLPHSAAWSEQHQAAQSKWCRIAQKYEQLEAVFTERRPPPPPQAAAAAAQPPEPAAGLERAGGQPPPPPSRRHADAGGLPEPLLRFAEDLSAFATFTTLTPLASLRYSDPPTTGSMVAGASFDRDDEFFAVAGVSKRIKIYEREAVLQSNIGAHYPVLEISSRSRLSSVTWSGYIKGHLASADYEGVVQLWDANTNSELMQFEEHRKRVWSIDFSQADPARLLSGGDDGLVKLWSIQQDTSTATIDLRANVCSVQFSPTSPHLFAAGCANYRIFLYDMRNTSRALAVLPGHKRAVSYVRFLSPSLLVSASTDNTLRLWQLDRLAAGTAAVGTTAAAAEAAAGGGGGGSCVQVFRGHQNERNFTGLSVSPDGYISCGSENNRVYCYYQSLPMPVTCYDFSAPDADEVHGGSGGVGAAAAGAGGGLDGGGGSGALAAAAGGGGGGGGMGRFGGGGGSGADWAGAGAGSGAGAGAGAGTSQFVSSVCWSRRSNLLLAANSVGLIKLFTLH
ncbi:hypothetical protein PLESTB_000858000 [Pleodorina starrii]|uniref:Response regulatory domain-containing protein n=1 Tax=Pleodorina starrii TaxID=330485 RepID=A0A9W6BLM9_9CHLO|nr:hypothetical protein PLESTM_001435900 [Pleodorina starrii]GLC54384.1 hypothetical protein PLESTB_000858000 [Pleodorina starrii]